MYHLVFVEDDPELGQLIADFLARHDMSVHIEPRGDTALQCIEERKPDLVLLDIMLPGVDGLTLCRDLRPRFTGPIVMLTALDSDMNQILGLELGANDYILKTTPPSVLLARLRVQRSFSGSAKVKLGAPRAPAGPTAPSTATNRPGNQSACHQPAPTELR